MLNVNTVLLHPILNNSGKDFINLKRLIATTKSV